MANSNLQLLCVSNTISNWFESLQPQRAHISTVTKLNAPFIQISNRLTSGVDHSCKFSECIFKLLQYPSQRPSSWAALMTKTDLTFAAFSLRFLDFQIQFCLCCKFLISFHKKQLLNLIKCDSGMIFLDCNHNSLLRIATNEIASFCIDSQ